MVYLKSECVGGGTNFPRLPRPEQDSHTGQKWCEFIKCRDSGRNDQDESAEDGVTFRPRRGSAVFWMNFDSEGRGYKETIHAGMPVTEGQKIGLNIWSWYQLGHRAPETEM